MGLVVLVLVSTEKQKSFCLEALGRFLFHGLVINCSRLPLPGVLLL